TSLTSYVGVAVVILVLISLASGWRWSHTLVVLTGWLAIGSTRWYHPSYWLSSWPFLGSAPLLTRWRFVAMLGGRVAAARRPGPVGGRRASDQGRAGRRGDPGHRRGLPRAGPSAVAARLLHRPRAPMVPGPSGPRDRQRRRWLGIPMRPARIWRDQWI